MRPRRTSLLFHSRKLSSPLGFHRCEVLAMSFELILLFLRPIEPLLLDESGSDIMGNPDASWCCERDGGLCQEPTISYDASGLRAGFEVIANQLGKKLDADNPLLGAHLPDGRRLASVIPSVVSPASSLTIRKFNSRHYTVDDLIARGTLRQPLADFLADLIRGGKTLLISGGTGTRKTTLLRIPAVGEVLALRGWDREAKRFLIEPVFEVQHAAAQATECDDHCRRLLQKLWAKTLRDFTT